MGRAATAAAVVVLLVFLYFALLAGIPALGSDQTSEVPLWLRNIETWSGIFQAVITSVAIVVGGIVTYYRFFKEKPYEDQLQPSVSTGVSYSADHFLVVITATVANAGQVKVALDKDRTLLLVATRKLGDSDWGEDEPRRAFETQDTVQPNETISDQVWLEISDDDEVALRTDFVVAVVKDEDKHGDEDDVWGWGAIDIVNLLDVRGNISDTSSDGVESEG